MLGPWLYWLLFALAACLLAAAIRTLWQERAAKRLWDQLHPLTPAEPITPLREATVLGMALGNLLNAQPDSETRWALRDHFDEVVDGELEAGSYNRRLVGDAMLASVTGLTRRLRAAGSPR